RTISDPEGIEGDPGSIAGLGLLDVDTVLSGDKRLEAVTGRSFDCEPLQGYEMHIGRTTGLDCARPFADVPDRPDGAMSVDGRIVGTYLHGLFASDRQRAAWLCRLGGQPSGLDYEAGVDAVLDRLAAHMEQHLDLTGLFRLAR